MEKFAKGCLAIAGIFIGIGIILGAIVSIIGGRSFINMMRHQDVSFWNWDNLVVYNDSGWIFDREPLMDSLTVNDSDVLGREHQTKIDGSKVDRLIVDLGGCRFDVRTWDEDYISIDIAGRGDCEYYTEDGCLYITGFKRQNVISTINRIDLLLPERINFSEIIMEIDATVMDADGIRADYLSCNVGAGEIDFSDIRVNELDVEVSAGALSFDGRVDGDVSVTCDLGSIDMELEGRESDYNYSLAYDLAGITLNGATYSQLGGEKNIDNRADYDIYMQCSLGHINLDIDD